MNAWNEASSPDQATPAKVTFSLQRWYASSTEGASRLHVLQVGAQNQNAIGLSTNVAEPKSPPPTSGALN